MDSRPASTGQTPRMVRYERQPGGSALCLSAVGEPAGPPGPPGLAGDQVVGEQQDGRADDGGDPGGEIEESLQGVMMEVEQLSSRPAAEQRTGDADYAGQDKSLLSPAGDQHVSDEACTQAENNPGDDAHNRLL